MASILAPYAAAEIARLRETNPDRVGSVRNEQIAEAEEQFSKIVAGSPELQSIHRLCEERAKKDGFPRERAWPNDLLTLNSFQPEELSALGEHVSEQWATLYKVDAGALAHRIELVSVLDIAFAALNAFGRAPRLEAQGAGLLRGLEELHPGLLKRLDEEDWWHAADRILRSRVVCSAAFKVLREIDLERIKAIDRTRRFVSHGCNVAGILGALAEAPFVIWRAAHEEVKSDVAGEQLLESKLPRVQLRRADWPTGRRRGKVRGPVGIALDGMGMRVPDAAWAEIADSVLESLGRERTDAVCSWAYSNFARRVIHIVAQRAVLGALVQTIQPPYSAQVAKSVIASFVTDHAYLERSLKTSKIASATGGLLFWSAVGRGWYVAYDLLGASFKTASHVEYHIRATTPPMTASR